MTDMKVYDAEATPQEDATRLIGKHVEEFSALHKKMRKRLRERSRHLFPLDRDALVEHLNREHDATIKSIQDNDAALPPFSFPSEANDGTWV